MSQPPYAPTVAKILQLNTTAAGTLDRAGIAAYARRLQAAATRADTAGDTAEADRLYELAYVHRAAHLAAGERRRRWWW